MNNKCQKEMEQSQGLIRGFTDLEFGEASKSTKHILKGKKNSNS